MFLVVRFYKRLALDEQREPFCKPRERGEGVRLYRALVEWQTIKREQIS